MNLGMQANIGQTQEQTLSPALLQSVKMLQKTSQELETAIRHQGRSRSQPALGSGRWRL